MGPAEAAVLVTAAMLEFTPKRKSSAAQRTARWRAKKASQTVTSDATVTGDMSDEKPSQTVTNRHSVTPPTSSKEKNSRLKRHTPRTRIGDGFSITESMVSFASSKGFDHPRIAKEFDKFRNYHQSKGSVFADWLAAWRNWVANAIEFEQKSGQQGFKWNGGIEGVI